MDAQLAPDGSFRTNILPGERIVWQGQPAQGILVASRDVFLIPFSLLWGGFALFWGTSVMQSYVPGPYKLMGILVLVVGVYLVVGRFFVDAWLRGRTQYAVTNQRILISRSGPFANFTSMAIDRLPELSLTEKGDGQGTIRFAPNAGMQHRNALGFWHPSADLSQFLLIQNVRSVFDQIQKLAAKPAG